MSETKLKICDSEIARYTRRLTYLESMFTLQGEQSHEQFIPAFKVKSMGHIVYSRFD